jgi:two-component system cell cycle response regulator DivK
MDNWIPGIGGVTATQLIKNDQRTQAIPVIFFSANNNIEGLAKEARADYYLKKPFDITELAAMVENAAK